MRSAPHLSPDTTIEPSPSRTPGPFNTDRPADPSHSDLQHDTGMPSLVNLSRQSKKGRATNYILVGLAAAAIAAVAFLSLRRSPEISGSALANPGDSATPADAALNSAAATPSGTASAAPATTASTRVVRIETEPAGATVSEDGKELCPSTPCDVTFEDEGGAKEHKLALNKKGYKAGAMTVSTTDTKVAGKLDGWSGGGPAVTAPTGTGQTTPPKFDGCLDDSDCKGGRHCMHGWCK